MKVWYRLKHLHGLLKNDIIVFFMLNGEKLEKLKNVIKDSQSDFLSDRKYSTEEVDFLISHSLDFLPTKFVFGKLKEDCSGFDILTTNANDLF